MNNNNNNIALTPSKSTPQTKNQSNYHNNNINKSLRPKTNKSLRPKTAFRESQNKMTPLRPKTASLIDSHFFSSHNKNKQFPKQLLYKRVESMDNTLTSNKSSTYNTLNSVQTTKQHNKKFIIDRIQSVCIGPSLYRRRSCVDQHNEYDNIYNNNIDDNDNEIDDDNDDDNRTQLVYIGGINNLNKYDVCDRLYDLFEIWCDNKPQLLWTDNC
eukprot:112932_1